MMVFEKSTDCCFIDKEGNVVNLTQLQLRLDAAEKVVEESRLLQSDGFLRYEEALEDYDKVMKNG